MIKKVTLLAMAMGAVMAFAAPAAFASVTAEGVEPNDAFTASSSNITITMPGFVLKCDTVDLFGNWAKTLPKSKPWKEPSTAAKLTTKAKPRATPAMKP